MSAKTAAKTLFVGAALVLALSGCIDGSGGGDASFAGWWELPGLYPGEERYGPTDLLCIRQTGSDVYLRSGLGPSGPLAVSGNTFSGWAYGDESDGDYITGTLSGSTIYVTERLWWDGVVMSENYGVIVRTTMPLDGSVQGSGIVWGEPVSFDMTPALALKDVSTDRFKIEAEDATGSIEMALWPASGMTVASIYTVGSDIELWIYIQQDEPYFEGGGQASGGTVTLSSTTSSRIVGTYDVAFTDGGSLSGSFDFPHKEGP